MLAMHRDPFARYHAGREPQPEAEAVTCDRMQVESPMRLMAMQEDRDARDGHVREQQRDADVAPDREVENAAERHIESYLPLRTDLTIPAVPASGSTRGRKLPPVPSGSY